MVNSRAKGSKNERELAKVFSKWAGFEFAKVPASGGLGWKMNLAVTGDIIPTHPKEIVDFPFTIETKFYKEIEFQDPLLGQSSDILEFWWQASRDGKEADKIPLVLMRRNLMAKSLYFAIVSFRVYAKLKKLITFTHGFYNYNNEFVIFLSKDLFRVPYQDVRNRLQGYYGTGNSNNQG